MNRIHIAMVFATTMLVVFASEAQPQSPDPVEATPLAVAMLNSIDASIVIADLKLKDEQVKTLVARRKNLWDETYTTAPKKLAETAAARTEATDALLKQTLTAEQYKRAVQLGAQSLLWNRPFGGETGAAPTFRLTNATAATLNRYPELSAVFKLTDDQKQQLGLITMTEAQADAAKEFLGTVSKTWLAKLDPRSIDRPFAPANFSLLEARDVRTDLQLTDAETKTLTALAEKWQKLTSDRSTDLSPKEADAQAAVLKTESEQALDALASKQLDRLKQIALQTGGPGGPGFPFVTGGFGGPGGPGGFVGRTARDMRIDQSYTNTTVAKELVLTEDQVKEFRTLQQAFDKEATTILGSADASTAAEKKLNELVGTRRTKAEAVLTADQAAKLNALVGKPFIGTTQSDLLRGTSAGNFRTSGPDRTAWFGHHTFGDFGLLATNLSVQTELKLDEKQTKKAVEVRDAITTKFPSRGLAPARNDEAEAKMIASRSAAIAEELGNVLSEDQAKRFRQIMLQYWERQPTQGSGNLIRTAASYPGVAAAIKLTDEQKLKLIAGALPAEVLSDAQKSSIKEMLGTEFKGSFTITAPGGALFPQQTAIIRLFARNDKIAEQALKFTAEQTKVLAAARETYQNASRAAPPTGLGANRTEFIAALTAAYQAFDMAIADTLTADQKPRLAQLAIQYDAAANLVATLTSPEMVKQLELTKEQTESLTALGAEAMRLQALRATHMASDERELKLGLQMRDAADDRMMAVLTAAQKTKWKELTGEPLAGLQKTVPRQFVPAGFGGGSRLAN